MTDLQVFQNPEFGDIRIISIDDNPWFVGKDVATALGYQYPKDAIRDNVDNEDKQTLQKRENLSFEIPNRGLTIINESGFYSLVLGSKLPRAKEFKHWVTSDVLPSIRKTGFYSNQKQFSPVQGNEVRLVSQIAADIQSLFAVKQGIAISQAIDIVTRANNVPLLDLKKLIPPAEYETGFMNATQLGEKLGGIPAKEVNQMLAKAGLQYKDGEIWRLTELGKAYGEEMPYTRNNHSGYQIRWNGDLLKEVKQDEQSCITLAIECA